MKHNRMRGAAVVLAASLAVWSGAAWADFLPNLKADPNATTVSGISSGGYQAVQMHFAHSATVKGAAVFAGGPYYCAESDLTTALSRCMSAVTRMPLDKLIANAENWARQGAIDPIENLKSAKVYLFQGTDDSTVKPPVGKALNEFYRAFVDPTGVAFDDKVKAEHAWITWKAGAPVNGCAVNGKPYIDNCGSDPQKTFLEMFYGPLQPKAETATGRIAAFDQNEFFDDKNAAKHSLAENGYAYIPAACEGTGANCRVHLALHGCKQYYGLIGDAFVRNSGLNEWADGNKLIVLYPQTVRTAANDKGCWDWWGYDDKKDYAKQTGPQIQALKRMIDRAVGADGGPPPPPPAPVCFRDSNVAHVAAGRAYVSGGVFARAKGSEQPLGGYNPATIRTLKQTRQDFYVVGECP